MGSIYKIFEKFPDGQLVFVESVESLEEVEMRFLWLTANSQREYLIWDPAKGYEVALKRAATD
jgi:hypothetical protein